ncbi:MAG: response regulator transcription factor [Flavobacteriales bacterium]|uniref:response regulator n=1 Tax=Sanyastnella coralliicola TaxID=3069118 RepID=UPI0027BA9C9B|nr:response regulator transcription factor [Longitalea sp. SCSIO 12813]MCH2198683.1 response regulator transcription factor [Flavobacteriales bacterium]
MIDVVICDDHKIVREGLSKIISNFPDIKILSDDIASGEELLQRLRKEQPDVIVLDVSLPGRSGLEVLKQVKIFYPEIKVLVLSMYPEDQFAIRMLKAGASGYLHKDSAPEVLIDAIRTVQEGGEYLSPAITKLLYREMNNKNQDLPHKQLSDREYEVFLAIGEGKANNQIASQLMLSAKTISTYRSRILTKMNMDNNSDIIKYILLHNLLPSA